MWKEYPNQFARIGVSGEQARARVEACFETLFFDPEEKIYHDVDPDSGCMVDTGNDDARTEGMSYGMMMCVQMNRKDLFDKLWRFAWRYMRLDAGPNAGYFAWSVRLDGRHNAEGPAPDGEEYFAMALLMASARWGEGTGETAYGAQAREILLHCLHQPEMAEGGRAMWDEGNRLIRFVPEADFSDPSYHLPHFYELFARHADEADRAFWREAAECSRSYMAQSAHPNTGLSAEYAEYDGRPRFLFDKDFAYYSDAYRVAMNIALDTLWFGRREALSQAATRLQDFFADKDPADYRAYQLDGSPTEEPAMHPVAMIAVLAAASIASDSPHAEMYLRRFWDTPLRRGKRRYYDNCLYFFCLLMLAGEYRVYE